MSKIPLVLLVGVSLAALFTAYSSPVIDRPKSIVLVLEIEHVQKGKLSNDERAKLETLTRTLKDATSDEQRMRAERRLASFQTRTERTRGLLLFGRATFWLPTGRRTTTPLGNFVPQFGDHATGAVRRDDPIIVGVDPKLMRRTNGLSVGDFVRFSVVSEAGRAETVVIELPVYRALRARGPLHKIEQPAWWPEPPIDWFPVWKEPNRQLTASSGLTLVGEQKEYKRTSKGGAAGYYLIFQIRNDNNLDVKKASVWFRFLDGDGDVIGVGRPSPQYFRVGSGESVDVRTKVSAAVYEAYARAELSVELVERPTKP